jgi:chromosome partitioning protein
MFTYLCFLGNRATPAGVVILVCQHKGGVGKTTVAVHAAVWLIDRGKRVAVVDSDPQQSAQSWLAEAAPHIQTVSLPTPDDLLDKVPELRGYDHLIIDGQAIGSEVTRAGLLLADLALVPCTPSALDLRAAVQTLNTVKQCQRIRDGKPQVVLVGNRVQALTALSRDLQEALQDIAQGPGVQVATAMLGLRAAFAEAASQGKTVWSLGYRARVAASEVERLFKEVFHRG